MTVQERHPGLCLALVVAYRYALEHLGPQVPQLAQRASVGQPLAKLAAGIDIGHTCDKILPGLRQVGECLWLAAGGNGPAQQQLAGRIEPSALGRTQEVRRADFDANACGLPAATRPEAGETSMNWQPHDVWNCSAALRAAVGQESPRKAVISHAWSVCTGGLRPPGCAAPAWKGEWA